MTGFSNKKSLNLWSRILNAANPGLEKDVGSIDGVRWVRERHTYRGNAYAFFTEVYTITMPGPTAWILMVVNETWWEGSDRKVIRTNHWGAVKSGRKADVLAWLRRQEQRHNL